MSSFKRSFLLVFDCSFSLCLHVFTGYWIFIRRQTLCVFGGFVKMFCTMIYKRCLFNTQKMSIEEHATMKYFYNAGKKINHQRSCRSQRKVGLFNASIDHWPLTTGHCFWIRTSVLFKHILIVPIGKETLRINGIVHVINKSKY